MAHFAKLTNASKKDKPIIVNVANITYFELASPNETEIMFSGGQKIMVVGTTDDVVKAIRKAK